MFKIHLAGHFLPGQVEAAWVASTFRLTAELKKSIEMAWEKAIAEKGKLLFDGPLCRLESWRREGDRLALSFSLTSYKWFWGTNLAGADVPAGQRADALGLSAIVESSDGFLLLGRRNDRVAYHPSRVHPFAGSAVDADVFAEIRRELAEELGFTSEDIAYVECIGLAEDVALRQRELIFRVRATQDRARVEARLDAGEHEAVWATRAERSIADQAISNQELTPIAQAALRLWSESGISAG